MFPLVTFMFPVVSCDGLLQFNAHITVPSAENLETSKLVSFKTGLGKNLALHFSPTAKVLLLDFVLSLSFALLSLHACVHACMFTSWVSDS